MKPPGARRDLRTGVEPALGDGRTLLMGVVNVTPDSFFDGGQHDAASGAVDHALRLVDEGADILDIGGESTRPGHDTVSDDEQLRRVLPVVEELVRRGVGAPLSIDTTRSRVARETLDAGAHWINDTLALRGDPELGAVVAAAGCPLVLMHRFEPSRSQQADAVSDRSTVAELAANLRASAEHAERQGVAADRILLDPGIGFGTRHADNIAMHAHMQMLKDLGYPLLVGPSRKSYLGEITGRTDPADRLHATSAAVTALALSGVEVIRVHDVAAMRDVVQVADAIRLAQRAEEASP